MTFTHLTYSHTDYSDIWPIYFGETSRYFRLDRKKFFAVEMEDSRVDPSYAQLLYDEGLTYPQRLYSILQQLDEDVLLFDHEDMFLYDYCDVEAIRLYWGLVGDGVFDSIRLIKGGKANLVESEYASHLYEVQNSSRWIFSIQPSIWNRKALMMILEQFAEHNIWELENLAQSFVRERSMKFGVSWSGGRRRGLLHFDNGIYPYIATAIGKGQWNYLEYRKELDEVFKKYAVDRHERGCNTWNYFSFIRKS